MNTETYYAALRQQRETLAPQHPSGFCLVMSLDNSQKNSTPGNLCEVTVADAARLLMDGTHRVATADEFNAYKKQQGVERARIRKNDLDRTRETFESVMGVKRA
jgi:hypothetical protein